MNAYRATDKNPAERFDDFFNKPYFTDREVEFDAVDNPRHYTDKAIECIDYIEDTVPDPYSFSMGNVIKYVSRHMNKNGKQDLLKAKYYLEKMIDDYND
jgi:hypothetical protein